MLVRARRGAETGAVSGGRPGAVLRKPTVARAVVALALALPLVGLGVLLRGDLAEMRWERPGLHFFFFLVVAATAASLSLVAWTPPAGAATPG